MERADGRRPDEIRPVRAEVDFVSYPEGSVLFSLGGTRVLCNVTVEEGVPRWMQEHSLPGGWVTAEYAMLPRSTHTRTPRETGAPRGRSAEIRRIVGRSLRAAVRLHAMPPVTCTVDCDVIQADGGTRTAAVTGGYLALALALHRTARALGRQPDFLAPAVAAISLGRVDGQLLVDLDYGEDSQAEFDLNLVMNAEGELVEIQGTAEQAPLPLEQLERVLELGRGAIQDLLAFQAELLAAHSPADG